MKKITLSIAALALAFGIYAATRFEPGLSNGGAPYGCRIAGAIVVTTNATATCKVEAVYAFGEKTVTNELYTLTCAGGIATNGQTRLVAPNAQILVTGEAVTLFQE